jgi:hypothetical protein
MISHLGGLPRRTVQIFAQHPTRGASFRECDAAPIPASLIFFGPDELDGITVLEPFHDRRAQRGSPDVCQTVKRVVDDAGRRESRAIQISHQKDGQRETLHGDASSDDHD